MRNKVILTGRITATPELRQNVNNDYVCTFYIATRRKKSKNVPEPQTDFIRCEAWGNNAIFLSRYVRKGTLLDIEGSIRVRKYTDKEEKVHIEQIVRTDAIDFSPTNNSTLSANTVFDDVGEDIEQPPQDATEATEPPKEDFTPLAE